MRTLWAVVVLGAAQAVAAERGPSWTLGLQARMTGGLVASLAPGVSGSLGFESRFELGRLLVSGGAGWLAPASFCQGPALCVGGPFLHASVAALLNPDDPAAVWLGAGLEPRLLLASGTVGFVPFAEAGVLLWRQRTTRLSVDARVGQNVLPVLLPSDLVKSVTVYPTEVSVGVTLGW
jgi:hypothetical protein